MVGHLQRTGLASMLKSPPPPQNDKRKRLCRLWSNLLWPPMLQQRPRSPFLYPFLRAYGRRPNPSSQRRTCLRRQRLRHFRTCLCPNHHFPYHRRRWVFRLLQCLGLLCPQPNNQTSHPLQLQHRPLHLRTQSHYPPNPKRKVRFWPFPQGIPLKMPIPTTFSSLGMSTCLRNT